MHDDAPADSGSTARADDDVLDALVDRVREARSVGGRLRIQGGGSKAHLLAPAGPPDDGAGTIVAARHRGVVSYEPSELSLTARAGTPLAEVVSLLARHGQALPFEPPAFGAAATLGGTVACGWAGPARPWRGAVRDAVLGVRLVNGLGQCLHFGGEVMKNVAGYDLARLQAGAFGRLGMLVEVSLKVLPRPACSRTRILELDRDRALTRVVALQRGPNPVTGTAHVDGRLHVRFQGNEAAVTAAAARCGGTALDEVEAEAFWGAMREHQHGFFQGPGELWRLSLPHAAPVPDLAGNWCIEWAGAQRWLRAPAGTDLVPAVVFAAAAALGGHAVRWGPARAVPAGHAVRRALERRLAEAFDPDGVFAPAIPATAVAPGAADPHPDAGST
jgi:glycolate oxidase FAD binding subunit